MRQEGKHDVPLSEICFDFAAGMFDLAEFQGQVRDWLRVRMRCAEVLVSCRQDETTLPQERLAAAGWFAEAAGDRRLLHAALARNGRLIGLLSCVRDGPGLAWTTAEGIALRRHAITISSHLGCPGDDAQTAADEGAWT